MAAAAPKFGLMLAYKNLLFPIDFHNQSFLHYLYGEGFAWVTLKDKGRASSSGLLSGRQYWLQFLTKLQRSEFVFKSEWQ